MTHTSLIITLPLPDSEAQTEQLLEAMKQVAEDQGGRPVVTVSPTEKLAIICVAFKNAGLSMQYLNFLTEQGKNGGGYSKGYKVDWVRPQDSNVIPFPKVGSLTR